MANDGSLAFPLVHVNAFRKYFVLLTAAGTTAAVVQSTPAAIGSLFNQSTVAQPAAVSLYDAIAGDALTGANLIVSVILGVTPYTMTFQTTRGLTIVAVTSAVVQGVLVTYN